MNRRPQPLAIAAPRHPAHPAPGERLLLDGLRRWAASRIAGERPHDDVSRLIAWRTSPRAAALFVAWMQAVEAGRARPIQIHCRHCVGASTDEQRLIVSVGLAQVDMEMGEALLNPLIANAGCVMSLARALGVALAAEGKAVPARLLNEPIVDGSGRPTLH